MKKNITENELALIVAEGVNRLMATGQPSKKVSVSQDKLEEMVNECVQQAINEKIFGNTDRAKWHGSPLDFMAGREVLDGQPETIEDVLKGDHMRLYARKPWGQGERLYVVPDSHEFGAVDDFQKEQGFEEELNIVLNPQGKQAKYMGRPKAKPYIQVFDIMPLDQRQKLGERK